MIRMVFTDQKKGAAADWLFFPSGGCRTCSTGMNPDMNTFPPVRLGPPGKTAN